MRKRGGTSKGDSPLEGQAWRLQRVTWAPKWWEGKFYRRPSWKNKNVPTCGSGECTFMQTRRVRWTLALNPTTWMRCRLWIPVCYYSWSRCRMWWVLPLLVDTQVCLGQLWCCYWQCQEHAWRDNIPQRVTESDAPKLCHQHPRHKARVPYACKQTVVLCETSLDTCNKVL